MRVRSAVRGFYADGGVAFWRAFERDADAAVCMFRRHPQSIAPLHRLYEWMPLVMEAEQRRIIVLLERYADRLRVNAVIASSLKAEQA